MPANAGDADLILHSENPLEEEMATYSSILAGKSHRQKARGVAESDMTERLSTQKISAAYEIPVTPYSCQCLSRSAFKN